MTNTCVAEHKGDRSPQPVRKRRPLRSERCVRGERCGATSWQQLQQTSAQQVRFDVVAELRRVHPERRGERRQTNRAAHVPLAQGPQHPVVSLLETELVRLGVRQSLHRRVDIELGVRVPEAASPGMRRSAGSHAVV